MSTGWGETGMVEDLGIESSAQYYQNLRHIATLDVVSGAEFEKHQDMKKRKKEPMKSYKDVISDSHFSKQFMNTIVKGRFLVSTSFLSVMAWNVLVASWMLRPGEPTFLHVARLGDSGWWFGMFGPHGLRRSKLCRWRFWMCSLAFHINSQEFLIPHNDNGTCKHVGTGRLGLIDYD